MKYQLRRSTILVGTWIVREYDPYAHREVRFWRVPHCENGWYYRTELPCGFAVPSEAMAYGPIGYLCLPS